MSREKVLVADDSSIYRKLVTQALSPQGYEVLLADTGRQAVEFFHRERPSLVITDWLMPDLNGIELCRQIRSEAGESYVYIMILTSIAEKDKVVAGLTAGADDYLTKPFHRDELLARVRVGQRLLDLHHQIEEKNRLLEELALTDPLTGLPNRRAVDSWAERQLSGAARHGFSFWVTLIDLDYFKQVNDTHGHDAGDAVLRRFAEILKSHTRLSDICGRIGGEEFLQILTYASEQDTFMVLDRLRQAFEKECFSFAGAPVRVTASLGAAGCVGKLNAPPDLGALMSRADAALYRAKRSGRNRVELDAPR